MKEIKKVSVIIPTYNREQTIVRAIQSVLCQTYPVSEVIVADDCSTDNTESIVRCISDERVRYYRLPENRGAGGARNYGVERANYDMIAFHDSDDEWLPDKLARQMQVLDVRPECGLIYSAYCIHKLDGTELIVPLQDMNLKLEGDIFADILLQNTIGAPTVLMRKDIFYEVGCFDETMRSLEDWDFAIRVAEKYPIAFVSDVLLKVNQTSGSVSSVDAEYYRSRCYMLRKYRKQLLETGTFNANVMVILKKAEMDGILPQVNQMIVTYLSD